METSELLKKVRKIEIKTKGLSNQIFSGEYHSAFKGRGMAFSEVREYIPGDPIRSIDWNVTARFNQPYVKVFEEERELTVMLLIDVSGSENFGSRQMQKRNLITEVSAIMAFSAAQNNDKIGVILFSDRVEKFIPPKKGKTHILRIIRELLDFKPEHSGTDIAEALRFFNQVTKKRSIAFLMSDFYDTGYAKPLSIAKRKHDMVALVTRDPGEQQLPKLGLIPFHDLETGERYWINSSSQKVRRAYAAKAKAHELQMHETLRKSGVDYTILHTDKPYVHPLMNLFKQRESRR